MTPLSPTASQQSTPQHWQTLGVYILRWLAVGVMVGLFVGVLLRLI